MKCDELKTIELECNMGKDINGVEHREPWKAYDIDEVDEAIAEIKAELDKTIAERDGNQVCIDALKQKLEDVNELVKTARQMLEDAKATHYAEMVDAGMRERRLRRLLWHAIALFCARSCEYFNGIMSHCLMGQDDLYRRCEEKKNKYLNATIKFRAKAKEYK